MDLYGVLALVTVLGTLTLLGVGAVALVRWARRTGRRPWLWLLVAYVVGNILVWALMRIAK